MTTRYDAFPLATTATTADEDFITPVIPPPPRLPSGVVTMGQLDARLTNVERILLEIQAQQPPKWLRTSGWTSLIGGALVAIVRMAVFK